MEGQTVTNCIINGKEIHTFGECPEQTVGENPYLILSCL